MKRIIIKSLLVASLLSSVTVNAGHFSWGVSINLGFPVYCPPPQPVIYSPVVYHPQVVVVPQPIVRHVVYSQPVVVVAPPPVIYYPAPTIWVGGGHHHHGHRR